MPEREHKLPPIPKHREKNLALWAVACILAPLFRLFFNTVPKGTENLPKKGAYILVSNHTSYADPLAMAYFIFVQLGRAPHFLAKESLFRIPIFGSWLPHLGQVPIYRQGRSNQDSLSAAKAYLSAGHTIIMFPEGTLTRDPDYWPMRGRSGAIRLAIESGVPVFPVAHHGVEKVLPRYSGRFRPSPFKKVAIQVGPQVDLSAYKPSDSPAKMAEATEVVMQAITEELKKIRAGTPPEKRWDPKESGQAAFGNYRKKKK
jgi:1-acyl-sn-glycerol-3-phosphate acyltransferase